MVTPPWSGPERVSKYGWLRFCVQDRYEYKKDNMIYHDTYFGGTNFIGEEVVYIDNKAYWAMNYYGVTLDNTLGEEAMDKALRPALMKVGQDNIIPVRGPKEFNNGENIETQIDLSIEETFYGCNKKISLKTIGGKLKTFDVKIPAGIRNNEKIRLIGQGKKGINGGKNGDLFIKVNIEDSKKLKLRGINLYTDLYLTPWEAALGTKAKINAIDDVASVYIPQGIASGEKVRIQGKGYKDGKGGRGDLIAEVKIMVPKQISAQEKKLYTKLSEISDFNPRVY